MGHRGTPPAPRVVRDQPVGQVIVLKAAGSLREVAAALELTVRQALAEEPRGVVCDLADVQECAEAGALRTLAALGAYPQVWPAVPVAVVLPDPPVREWLNQEPPGEHLVVAGSRRRALEQMMGTRVATTRSLRLAPHPTAPRAARDFVSGVLPDHGLGSHLAAASVVVSELVTNAVLHARTVIEVAIAVSGDRCRISVRDLDPGVPTSPTSPTSMHGRGLVIVEGLASAHGVLPSCAGGKVVWAVLADALQPAVPSTAPPPAVPV
jgi:anti-sigma regulatory factor (Ser/Thr protein kinase)